MKMKTIIPPVDRKLLKSELTRDKYLRPTNKAGNHIYIVTAHDSPNVMREIGRLREMSFRADGGGSGEEIDTDRYDFLEKPFKQLIVWDPDAEEIIGGYRYIFGPDVTFNEEGQPNFVMQQLFDFSDQFIKEYMPHTIELGRAFVQPQYQTTKMGMRSLFALDNLWDGLGALIHSTEDAKYFIGKVTIYKEYPQYCRELIYEYLNKYFKDKDNLIISNDPVKISSETTRKAKKILLESKPADDYRLLIKAVRAEGENIPPLFNAYIGLTNTMKYFGTTLDYDFGHIYDSGILMIMDDLLEAKKQRYIQPYKEYLIKLMEERRLVRLKAKEERLVQRLKKVRARRKRIR